MSALLKDKVAVITGGSSGIGLATARRFVAEGAAVFITGRRHAELDAALGQLGGRATAVQADSSKPADLDRVYAAVKAAHGCVDIVFANAGILEYGTLPEITDEHMDKMLSINIKGTVFTVQKALPLMPDGGVVIMTSSTVAHKGTGRNSIYAGTKAAIRSFARNWAVDLKDRRIRVNTISPGPIETPGLKGAMPSEAAAQARLTQMGATIPSGRVGTPDDVASVALFLASGMGGYMNGADVQIDGGWAQI